MKKLSLQVKITLLCTAILTAACVLLTLSSMMFSSHELIGVARQATTVITDYAVSVKEAYNLQPAPTANSGREEIKVDQIVINSNLADFYNVNLPEQVEQSMVAITTAANDQIQIQVVGLMTAIILLGTLGIYLTVSRLTRPLRQLST